MRVFYITMEHMSKTNGGKGGDFIITSSVAGRKLDYVIKTLHLTKQATKGYILINLKFCYFINF